MVEQVGKAAGAGTSSPERADPEVVEKASRRKFTAQYKLGRLEEADRCEAGEIGALLRREGLYSSHLSTWKRQRESGVLEALGPRKRGPQGQGARCPGVTPGGPGAGE